MSKKSTTKRRSPSKRVTTVRDTKTGKVIRRTYTTKTGTTTRTYSGGRITSQTSTGSGAGMVNPADVRAGVDAGKSAMTKAAQTTATSAEIATYQKTGTSPAQIRVAAATQRAKERSRTQVLEQRQKLRAAPAQIEEPKIEEPKGTKVGGISGVGITSFTSERLPSGKYKMTATQSITGRAQYFESEYSVYEEPSIMATADKKVTSWLGPKQTETTIGTYNIFGTEVTFQKPTGPLLGAEKVGRGIVLGTEKASEYISFDPSSPGRISMRAVPSEERELLQSEAAEDIYVQARRREEEKGGFVQKWMPAGDIVMGSKSEYQADIRELSKEEGFTTEQTDTLVKGLTRKRGFGEGGEVGATLFAELIAELLGGGAMKSIKAAKGIGVAISQSPKALKMGKFLTGFTAIAGPAAVEGMIQLGIGKASTREETTRTERALTAGSSALIGGTVGGVIVSGSKLSGPLTTAVYIADPLEKPADVLASALTKTQAPRVFAPALGTLYGKTKTTTTPPPPTPTYTTKTSTLVTQPSALTSTATTTPALTKTLIPTTTFTPTTTPTRTIVPARTLSPYGTLTTTTTSTLTTIPTSTATTIPALTTTTTIPTITASSIFPFFDLGGFRRPTGLGVSIGVGRVTKYLPSIEAGLFGIKGKAPKFRTGIQIRPVTKRKRKKRTDQFKFNLAY